MLNDPDGGVVTRFDHSQRLRLSGGRWVALALVLVLALGVGGFFGWQLIGKKRAEREARQAASRFAAAWSAGSPDRARYGGTKPRRVAAEYERITKDLHAESVRAAVVGVSVEGDTARARLRVGWRLDPQTTWRYRTDLTLVRRSEGWLVRWAPSVVHPELEPGQRLVGERKQPRRASILDRSGAPLVTERKVVDIGAVPGKVPDPARLADSLRDILDIEAQGLEAQIRAAGPDIFVPVITLREGDFRPLENELRALPGVGWQESRLPLAPTRDFASALLGRVGPVTADIVKDSGGRYRPGDVAGVSGMQLRYDQRLAGRPGWWVSIAPRSKAGKPIKDLFRQLPQPGKPVQTTLDPRVQRAADRAVAAEKERTALVAVSVSGADVLAVANGPEVGGYNWALQGRYSPGSAFKVVSTLALLRDGLNPGATVACPGSFSVDGKSFRNYESFALGSVPFRTDFARSCNTAFVSLASRLNDRALTGAARDLGIGRPYRLGVDGFAGKVPPPISKVDHAAAMIGQGRVSASPLAMAVMAGSVARGSYEPPHLVVGPRPAGATEQVRTGSVKAETRSLRELMRSVVTSGTGQAAADAPGGPVAGKTGTAEYGSADPPRTHAWFVGFQGDIAFAVFVENGESGGHDAAPIAARFLTTLAD